MKINKIGSVLGIIICFAITFSSIYAQAQKTTISKKFFEVDQSIEELRKELAELRKEIREIEIRTSIPEIK